MTTDAPHPADTESSEAGRSEGDSLAPPRRRLLLGAAFLLIAGWGVIAAAWTPRGPLTNAEALWSITISVAVGFGAGRLTRSRWAIIGAPLGYAVALELTRIATTGPSVDAPHLSTFGLIALVTGRGVHGLLALLPMAVGAAYGAGPRRRIPIALATALVLAVTVAVAIPARTPALPGGVAELTSVNGLGLLIRGTDSTKPVLLFVPGTPGGSETAAMRRHLSALEQNYVVATLDRRGGGASYPALDATDPVTDVLTVTDYLRERFHQEKIHLLAYSGGSIPGVLAVHRAPQKFHTYTGTGQAVDLRASDEIFYTDILSWARATGRDDVAAQLEEQGPPPYRDFWGYEPFLLHENAAYGQRTPAFEIGAPEYTMLQKAHTLTAIMDTWSVLYPRMQDIDLRREVPSLAVPTVFIQGGNEMRGLSVLFDEWYAGLNAPDKRLAVIPGAGHRAMFEEPGRFLEALRG